MHSGKIKKTSIVILNCEWTTKSRDTNIVEPVLCYLEDKYNIDVIRTNYKNFLWKLMYYRPDALLLSNYVGAPENLKLMRTANRRGIKTFSLISEGNINGEEDAAEFFWGWNHDKEICFDLLCLWSERSKRLVVNNVPEAKNCNLYVSGATGFDRYQMLSYMTKDFFSKKYKRSEKKIVGIASWGFDIIKDRVKNADGKNISESDLYLIDTCKRLNDYYRMLITEHPDTLFVLKYHPGCIGQEEKTEFAGLNEYVNVLEIRIEENISDIINVCDFWISFDSTTMLEAWLLKKQTLFVNPTGGHIKTNSIVKGSVLITSFSELESAYTDFYEKGCISGFDDLEEFRKKLITDIIQSNDGKNHLRAAEKIYYELVHSTKKKKQRNLKLLVEEIVELLRELKWTFWTSRIVLKFSDKGKKYAEIVNRYNENDRMEEYHNYRTAIREFDGL